MLVVNCFTHLKVNQNLQTICISQNIRQNKIINRAMTTIPHQSNRIAKLKLMKDLKYGKVHLRQSLIEMSEFHDIQKLFKNRKQFYLVEDLDIQLEKAQTEEKEEQSNILMGPYQRMELFRRNKLNKKMNQRMFSHQIRQIQHAKPRVPKTTKMLQKFQNKFRNEMPISYKQQLRQSENNLQKIKRNNKAKFQYKDQSQKPLYQSRLNIKSASVSYEIQPEQSPRKRFISLKTSLPQKQKFVYPSIRQIMQGKLKQNTKGPVIDIKNIENTLDNYLNNTMKRMKIKIEVDIQPRIACLTSPGKPRDQHMHMSSRHQQNKQNQKSKINIERSFTRSQESSKNVIETMSSFYLTKHEKKTNFDKMVKNLKYDRPLTSSIRRKNYTVLGKDTLNPIQQYREISQQERVRIRQNNHAFYIKLIQSLQNYHEQQIPTTVYIIQQVKRVFETEYMLTEDILKDLIQCVDNMAIDQKTYQVLNELASFIGLNLSFSPQSSQLK